MKIKQGLIIAWDFLRAPDFRVPQTVLTLLRALIQDSVIKYTYIYNMLFIFIITHAQVILYNIFISSTCSSYFYKCFP